MSIRGVVIIDDLRELDIRPRDLFEKYMGLLREDVLRFFGDRKELVDIPCPGCDGSDGRVAFEKLGLTYVECSRCLTVYLSPRPRPEALEAYYRQSEAADFWDRVVMKETDKGRRAHIFRQRLDWLTYYADGYVSRPRTLVDMKSKHIGFLEETHRMNAFDSVIVVEPTAGVRAVCRRLGLTVAEQQSQWSQVSLLTAFEVLEREFDPKGFLKDVHDRLAPGGLFFVTGRSGSGFDLQVLWDKAKNVLPPDHMNLFSVEALQDILRKQGFEILELSTPGQLDIDIVRNSLEENPEMPMCRILAYVLRYRQDDAHQALQEFLQRYRLSSHLRVLCRKR